MNNRQLPTKCFTNASDHVFAPGIRANTTDAKYNQRVSNCDATSATTAASIIANFSDVTLTTGTVMARQPADTKQLKRMKTTFRSWFRNTRPLRPEKLLHTKSVCEAALQSITFGMKAIAQRTDPPIRIAVERIPPANRLEIAKPKPVVVAANSNSVRDGDHSSRRVAT